MRTKCLVVFLTCGRHQSTKLFWTNWKGRLEEEKRLKTLVGKSNQHSLWHSLWCRMYCMWPHAAQTTCECRLSDLISNVSSVRVECSPTCICSCPLATGPLRTGLFEMPSQCEEPYATCIIILCTFLIIVDQPFQQSCTGQGVGGIHRKNKQTWSVVAPKMTSFSCDYKRFHNETFCVNLDLN